MHHFNKFKLLVVLIGFCLATSSVTAGALDDFFGAAKRDDEPTVVRLLFRGLDPNAVDEQGNHALHWAIREGSLKVANFLLDQPLVQVEVRNRAGESPLMLAALKGELALARRLIERRAEVNKPGWTPLHYAASHPEAASEGLVRLLLEHHAYIDAESPNKTTPLMMAARYGHPLVVKLLLEEGADASLRNEQGLTALDFAIRAERPDAVALLTAATRKRQPSGTW